MDLTKASPGQRVHYIPFRGCSPDQYENGIIKTIPDDDRAFVVYHCAGNWDDYENYTAQNTEASQLREGWYLSSWAYDTIEEAK